MSYDFMSLSPKDFEALVSDLLSAAWGRQLESFKEGKDQGIDLLYTSNIIDAARTIVQCKRHWPKYYSQLKSSVVKERVKLGILEPERYVLVTSVQLSLKNKQELLGILAPYCSETEDIIGPDELNSLLRQFPEVERAHFKLWISSTAVLERVIHNKIFSITEDALEETRLEIGKLVVHEGFSRALNALENKNHVLLVGNPGIGKTTLARMLMCHFLDLEYRPIWVGDDIGEVNSLVRGSLDKDSKQLIVYDDFLGQFQFDSPRFGKNEDNLLMMLADKVQRSSNLKLILTTREYILEDAKRVHGVFSRRADEIVSCTVSLENYSRKNRAEVLFNHLYFSDLPESRLNSVVESKVYKDLVSHQNFNPRVVEHICRHSNSSKMSDENFLRYIKAEFSDPSKLWIHPFDHEISNTARRILCVLWSFAGQVDLEKLKLICERVEGSLSRDEFEKKFRESLKQLIGSFIRVDRFRGVKQYLRENRDYQIVQFQNPSVREFLQSLMKDRQEWLSIMIEYATSYAQIETILSFLEDYEQVNLDASFRNSLQEAFGNCNDSSTGLSNIILAGESKSELSWDIREFRVVEETLLLVRLDNLEKSRTSPSARVHDRLLTVIGWKQQYECYIDYSDTAYRIYRLTKWLAEKSTYSSEVKNRIELRLRGSLLEHLDVHAEIYYLSDLLVLLESATLIEKSFDKPLEKELIDYVFICCSSMLQNIDDEDELRSEHEAIVKLSTLLQTNLSVLENDVQYKLDDILEESSDDGLYIPKPSKYVEKEGEIDLDEYFKGLKKE